MDKDDFTLCVGSKPKDLDVSLLRHQLADSIWTNKGVLTWSNPIEHGHRQLLVHSKDFLAIVDIVYVEGRLQSAWATPLFDEVPMLLIGDGTKPAKPAWLDKMIVERFHSMMITRRFPLSKGMGRKRVGTVLSQSNRPSGNGLIVCLGSNDEYSDYWIAMDATWGQLRVYYEDGKLNMVTFRRQVMPEGPLLEEAKISLDQVVCLDDR